VGWLKRVIGGDDGPGRVGGRATVAPASTRQHGDSDASSQAGGLSPDERLWVQATLYPTSVADGGAVVNEWQSVRASVPNWVMCVLYSAGTNEPLAAKLPASIEVPVTFDPTSRRIRSVDVEGAMRELDGLRAAVVEHLERADGRLVLPGDVASAASAAVSDWKDAVGDLVAGARNPQAVTSSWSPDEVEAMRRNAAILAVRFQLKPKEREKGRARALQALSLQLQNVATGAMTAGDFAVMVMREEVSTAITADEAAAFRRDAGLHG
jgi:hypothetical protein